MKIIQITDLHVGNENEFTHGVDVRQNFLDILKVVRHVAPDLLVLSGDLCFDSADPQVYQWLKSHLDYVDIPYAIIGGNHDDSMVLADCFKIHHLLVGDELYYKRLFGEYTLLFLETSRGSVSDGQLTWLDRQLSSMTESPIIFMHHPPMLSGVPHMDQNYALKNMDAVQSVLCDFPRPLTVFCGHYHVEKTVCYKNLIVHITPSTYFQLNWRTEGFQVDHYRPAYREINLRSDGIMESSVIYLDGNRV